jgi:hypothetical protein
MENNQEIIKLLSQIFYAQEEYAAKALRCYAWTIVLLCVLIVALLPILWSAWHMVLVRTF